MTRSRRRFPWTLAGLLCLALCASHAQDTQKPTAPALANPHADGDAADKTPKGWSPFSTDGRYEFAVDREVFHSPPSSARIRGFDDSGRACVSLTADAFRPAADYILSFWVRAERACTLSGFVRLTDAVKPEPGGNGFFMHSFVVSGKPGEWRRFSTTFHLSEELRQKHPTAKPSVTLYGDKNGTVWFDDVELMEAPPNPLEQPITKLKNLYLDTLLVDNGKPTAALALGADKRYAALAEKIQQKIKECTGATLPVLGDLPPEEALKTTNVIALGNMATNPFIETLYRRFFTFLDLYYPGKGGWELRTLHNPYGTGRNVLFVGGSDDDGGAKAVEALVQKLTPGKTLALGWTMEIKLGAGMVPPKPGDPVKSWYSLGANRPSDKFFGWNPINVALAMYYMTGDAGHVDDFRRLISTKGEPDARLSDGDRMFMDTKHPVATVYHYRGHTMPLIWDLVEESPVFTDEERLYVTNELRGHQNYLHLSTCKAFAENGLLPDRHAMHEMLCIWTGSWYFARSYPHPVWNERMEAAEGALKTSLATPACNTPRIQVGTVIWPALQYALYSGKDDYFRPGGVFQQHMEKWLFMGDEVAVHEWFHAMLNATAHVLKDGRFPSVRPIPQEDLNTFSMGQSFLSGVEPKPLTGMTGLRCFKMCEANHRRLAMNVPLDEAFEALIYRSSVDEATKQHLFLYGYYEGSKSPPRANAILNYQNRGIRLLRSGQQSAVFVRKDGILEGPPSNAAGAKCVEEIGNLAYARTEVPDHDFSRWERSLFLVKERCLVVFDRVIAREDGNFEMFAKWYPAQLPKPEPDGLRWTSGDRQCAVLCAEDVEIGKEDWAIAFTHRGEMKRDESRLFRSLVADAPGEGRRGGTPPPPSSLSIAPFGDGAALVEADGVALVGRGQLAKGDFAADAEAYIFTPDVWTMVKGTRLAAKGVEIKADNPVSVSWNLATGSLVAKAADKDAVLTVAGKTVACPAGKEVKAEAPAPNAKETIAQLTAALGNELKTALASRKPAAAPQPAKEIAPLGLRWRAALPDAITAVHVFGDGPNAGILVGAKDGTVRLLRPNGSQRWAMETGDAVHALASAMRRGERILFVGSDDEHLYALNENGDLVWKYRAQVSEWMAFHFNYWTMGKKAKVRRILPVDVEDDGKLDVLIGTGGAAIERLDEDGKPQWLFTFLYGTPMSLVLADVRPDRPGKELIAGTFDVSYDCVIRYVDPATGKELGGSFSNRYAPRKSGPRKREPSSFAQGNTFMLQQKLPDGKTGLLRAVCGGNWNNLVTNDAATGACLWGKDFGPGGGAYLRQYISGVATPDLNGDGFPDAVAGALNGWVCAYDGPTGRPFWATYLRSPVTMLVGPGAGDLATSVLAGCEDGGVVQLDKTGQITHRAQVSGQPKVGGFVPGESPLWIVGTLKGELVALSPHQKDAKFPDCPALLPFHLAAVPGGGGGQTPVQSIGIGEGLFAGAVLGSAKAWSLALPEGATVDIRPISPKQAAASTKGSLVELKSDEAGPLVIRIDPDPASSAYKRFIVIERDRWGDMRTNGPVAKVIIDGRMGFFMAKQPGDWIDLDVVAPEDGVYDVSACFCTHPDRPIVNVLLDGEPLKEGLDLYSEKTVWTSPVLLGTRKLAKGKHVLRFLVTGHAEKSTGYYVGIESIALVPEGQGRPQNASVTADASAVRADWQDGPLRYTVVFKAPDAQAPVTAGDVRLDGDACSIVRRGEAVEYWELRNGLSLRLADRPVVELDQRRDARSAASR